MAFDPTTATLVEDKPSSKGGFDPSTAKLFDPTTASPEPEGEVGSTLHNIGRTAAEAVVPTGAGLGGFGAGMTVAAPVAATVAPLTGPFAPVVAGAIELGGGMLGAFGASGVAQKVQNWMHAAFAPEDFKQRQIEKQQHETSTFLTQLGVGMAGMSPKTAVTAVPEAAGRLARLAGTPAGQRVVSGGLQGGIEAGTELAQEGKVTPWKVATSAAAGAAMPGFNPAGKLPFAIGEKIGSKIAGTFSGRGTTGTAGTPTDVPPKPPETATPEQRAEFLRKLKEIKAERDSKLPLVETAIRNKETGEIERMGPKHDEARKAETVDTHEQGFLDEKGNFLNRKEAWNRAQKTGQVKEGQAPERPQDGLHSGDLRAAGDERFALKQEEPAAPKTRDEHKTAINNLNKQVEDLSLERSIAEAEGRTQDAKQLDEKIKAIEEQTNKLHKDMPAPVIADKERMTWKETHDVIWNSKTVGEAFDRLLSVDSGSSTQKLLLKALNRSDFIRSATLKLHDTLISYKDAEGKDRNDAAGLYVSRDGKHHIDLGAGGNLRVFLHEGVHAATTAVLNRGKSKAATELMRLYNKHKELTEQNLEDAMDKFIAENPQATAKELAQARDHLFYGLTNVHEFVSEAFTNRHFSEALSKISSDGKPASRMHNMWRDFKQAVSEALGLKDRTALDDVLDQGIHIIESTRKNVPSSKETGTVAASRLSQEVHDDLQKQGIAVAHSSPHKFSVFNWIKHALSGEGAMVKGAGTYWSTKDSTNLGYRDMSKTTALETFYERNPGERDKLEVLEAKQQSAESHLFVEERNLEQAEMQRDYLGESAEPQYQKALKKFQEASKKAKAAQEALDSLLAQHFKQVKVPTYHGTFKTTPETLIDWESTTQSKTVEDAFTRLGVQANKNANVDFRFSPNEEEPRVIRNGEFVGWLQEDIDPINKSKVRLLDPQGGNSKEFSSMEEFYSFLDKTTGEDLYKQLSKQLQPSKEVAKQKHLEIFPDEKIVYPFFIEKMQKHLGDVAASQALAKEGVHGNVHNANFGKEKVHRNYVSFDDTLVEQNFVELASKGAGGEDVLDAAPKEPVAVDRTKTDPRDVKSEQEFYDIAAEIYDKTGEADALKFYEGYREYQKTWLEPISETEKFIGFTINSHSANERVASNNTKALKDLAGKDVDLNKLTYDIDTGTTLTGKAKQVADKFRSLMDELGKKALDAGVIKGWHEDYVARNVITEGNAPPNALVELMHDLFGTGGGKEGDAKTTTKYGKERRLKTREDLVDHLNNLNQWLASQGKDYRFKLKTDNLAEIYHDYAQSVNKAIENKKLVTNLKQIRNKNGESLIREITPENPLPHGWEVMDHSELAGYAVHPDLMPHLKFVFDTGPGGLMKALGTISQATKRINVIGSFFHAKSLLEATSSAHIPLWTPIKEGIVLPLVEKGVKAVTGKDIQLSAITKAKEQFVKGGAGDSVDQWMKSGLQLEIPEDVSTNVLSSIGKFSDTMIGKFGPKTRALEKTMSTVEKYTLGLFDKYTWDYLHTGVKIMTADAYLDKARATAAKQGKPFDEVAARKEISQFVNDSFGGLNWYDAAIKTQNEFAKRMALAAYSPAGRRGLQVMLFAPDWTLSTLRAFTSALPKELNPAKWHPVEGIKGMAAPTTKADYARLYQFKTALTYLTLLNAINLMTANRPIWENKDPTRIEWPDGTSMQAMKHAMEPYHWIMDPDKTAANKLGFIPKAAVIGIGGLEYASPTAQKLADPSAAGRLAAVAKTMLPFQIQAGGNAPADEGVKRAVLGTLGFPVYGSTPEEKKKARAEREKVLKEAAKKYHKKAKEKGWE